MEVIKSRPPNPMSEEQLKAFLEAVKADAELQEKLKAATDAEAVVAIAEAAGFVISAEELEALVLQTQAEMSDEELQGVAGGRGANEAPKEAVAVGAAVASVVVGVFGAAVLK
jgi:predicted ribosomally synthesized peptide with nif11-like leader